VRGRQRLFDDQKYFANVEIDARCAS
jgi:hypothetical protein